MDTLVGVGGVDLHSGRSGTIVDSQIVVLAACLPCAALDMNEVPSICPALSAVRTPRLWLRVMEKLG